MVFQVDFNQQLSQTNVKTLSQRCQTLICRAACLEQIRKEVIEPVLEFYSKQEPPRLLATDPVFLAWRLLRQGAMACLLLNNFRSGILESFNNLKDPLSETVFNDADARANIKIFLEACRNDLYMTDDQLFSEANLYTDDTNTLNKAITIIESFFTRIGKIQAVNYDKRIAELQETNSLFNLHTPQEQEQGQDTDATVPVQSRDLRLRVLDELLDTEQKYIADLDRLQNYAEELRMDAIISPESHRAIFSNLDDLVDFQRRFLMQMESRLTRTVLKDVKESYKANVAGLFISNEKGFTVYEAFCPNAQHATDTIALELPNLMRKARTMDPKSVLSSYLIKPTQRICKYPLLIRELLKQSAKDAPDRQVLEEAFNVVNRITLKVNEKKRRAEMALAEEELNASLKDWKGLDRRALGNLQLKDTATIIMGDNSKDLELYLFDTALLMFGQNKSLIGGKKNQLVMKGHIFITQVISVTPTSSSGETFGLKMTYRSVDIEYCKIEFKMEEKVKNWMAKMQPLIEAAKKKNIIESSVGPGGAKERRRKSLLASSLPIPSIAPNAVNAHGPVAPIEEEPVRLKIIYGKDIFVTCIFHDLTSLQALKEAVAQKLRSAYKVLDRPLELQPCEMMLKYIDDAKDLISLLDDTDVDTALTFSPRGLTVKVLE